MPRSPLVTIAASDLAKYFNTTTESSFINQTWQVQAVAGNENIRAATVSEDPYTKGKAYGDIVRSAQSPPSGMGIPEFASDVLNGALCVGRFLQLVDPKQPDLLNQIRLFKLNYGTTSPPKIGVKQITEKSEMSSEPDRAFAVSVGGSDVHPLVNLYAANVYNPFMGPMTKDIGALEIFMNAIPTIEFSKCVPYMSIDIISLLQTVGTTAPPLTLIGFLNPPALRYSDATILNAQGEKVASEAGTLGNGLRSGMELFTAPQTLVNLGASGPTFVPIIDQMRPLASLGNLSLSTKIQGGTMNFTTGRLEITIHDRSRLREVATFIRPDLYGTTFLDITYGWSHPEGGLSSRNAYGKFLDALKSTTRFRIAGSTYSFEEGGQVKVTLNIQTVGSTDLLYLGPKELTQNAKDVLRITRRLNQLLAEKRSKFPAPSMADYDFLSAFQDPSSALAASADKDIIQKARKLIDTLGTSDAIAVELGKLVGTNLSEKDEKAAGELKELQDELQASYDKIIERIPDFGDPADAQNGGFDFGSEMSKTLFDKMHDNKVYYQNPANAVTNPGATIPVGNITANTGTKVYDAGIGNEGKKTVKTLSRSDFMSYGSVFMNMIARQIANSGQYDEVQVVFYPFNKYAGAVHDLPISAFPIERERFKKAIDDLATKTPNVSCRQIIGLMHDRFTGFLPARAYLMAGFYNQTKANSGEIEAYDPEKTFKVPVKKTVKGVRTTETISVAANTQITFEERLKGVGIPEARFTMPQVQVAVEGCPLLDERGAPILDARGNPKTLIKIHVYDAAMDPHATLSDIVRAAKDNEIGVVTLPIANLNAQVNAGGRSLDALMNADAAVKAAAKKSLDAGVKLGILTPVAPSAPDGATNEATQLIDAMNTNVSYYQVAGGYDGIKRLVMAGMPYITYGSSTSAITNASLSSNTSPGLGNVQLLRAFTEPGETQAENLNSGVPMLVVPGQLSISTIGCPLFSPMQRLFIDFGTGTSIDNVYYVISMDSTIGKDGYKTDVKLAFADAFAQYRSLDQNLALLAHLARGSTTIAGSSPTAASSTIVPQSPSFAPYASIDPNRIIESVRKVIRNGFVAAAMPLAQIEANEKAKLERKLQKAAAKLQAKVEMEKAKVQAKIEAIIPEDVKIKIAQVQAQIAITAAEVQAAAEPVIRAALLAKQIADIILLANTLPGVIGQLVLEEALAGIQEAREQAAANAKSTT